MSITRRPAKAVLRTAAVTAALVAGSLLALASPTLAATTTSTTGGTTGTTSSPATTSTTSSGSTTGTSSTSCYRPPSPTVYPAGTVVKTVDFEDGTLGGFYAAASYYDAPFPTLGSTTEAAHGGTRALRVDGLTESNFVSTTIGAPSWGSFEFTAWVRLPAGSPPTRIRLDPSGQTVLASADRATPISWTQLAGKATPGTLFMDWYCNGSMTGTQLPGSIGLKLSVDRSCDPGPYASSLLLDDVQVKVLTSSSASNTTSGTWGPAPSCGDPVTTTTTTSTTSQQAGSCQVRYRIDGRWPGGFIANVEVRNTGTSAIPAWELGWTYPDDERVTSIWQATVTQSGRNVLVRPQPSAGLAAGASTSFGFLGDTGDPKVPASFTLSGRTCSLG